ncbi:HAD family hydrolase [Kitasatospora sp. NPDC056181]|uniref:HAD family hydrolase n=1 Tax=Kitasatospora sp. NPDC056181 TaxID=3345737 RepID=UPI0035DFEAE9
MNQKSLVCFDLEDTLIPSGPHTRRAHSAIIAAAAAVHGVQPEAIERRFHVARAKLPSALATYSNLGLDPGEVRGILDRLDPGPGVDAVPHAGLILQCLQELNVGLAIVTNAPCQWARRLLYAAKLDPASFNVIVSSCDVSSPKPSPESFELALQRFDVGANQAVMVGDRDDVDLVPARSLGMGALLVSEQASLAVRFVELLSMVLAPLPTEVPRSVP